MLAYAVQWPVTALPTLDRAPPPWLPQVKDAQGRVDRAKVTLADVRSKAMESRSQLQGLQQAAFTRKEALRRLKDAQDTWVVR